MIMIGEARVYLTKGLLNYKPRRTIWINTRWWVL
jgi:hypothetical protein